MTIKWVQQDPLVMNGEPFCYGSRLTVRQLLELRSNGYDLTRILTDHPELRTVGVAAAFTFAANNRERYADFFEADGSLAGPGYSEAGGRDPAGPVPPARDRDQGRAGARDRDELTERHRTRRRTDRLLPVLRHRPLLGILLVAAVVLACGEGGATAIHRGGRADRLGRPVDGGPVVLSPAEVAQAIAVPPGIRPARGRGLGPRGRGEPDRRHGLRRAHDAVRA